MSNMHGDSALVSDYVDNDFYERAARLNTVWERDPHLAGPEAHDRVTKLLYREARLLDVGDLDTWMTLFASQCLYWIPIVPDGGDPRHGVSWAFDDRRRLEDRVFWLQTGSVWSQVPPSRTVRQITNIEVAVADIPDQYYVRSNFLLAECHPRRRRTSAGWNCHLLQATDDGLRIIVKQSNLADSDHPQEKLTVLF